MGSSKKLAETVLAKRKVEIAEGKFLNVRKNVKIKFEDFANDFLNIYSKANKKSWKSDHYNLQSLKKYFGGKLLFAITIKDIEQFKTDRLTGDYAFLNEKKSSKSSPIAVKN